MTPRSAQPLPEQPALLPAGLREDVVVGGAERRLPVPDQDHHTHDGQARRIPHPGHSRAGLRGLPSKDVHPDHPGQVHPTGRAPRRARPVAGGARGRRGRLARRHLRLHRRRPVRGGGPLRGPRGGDGQLPAPGAGRVGRGDDGSVRRTGGVPRLRRRHAALRRRLRRRRLRAGDPRQGRRPGAAAPADRVRAHRAPADAPRHHRRDAGHRAGRHVHRDGRVQRRGQRPQRRGSGAAGGGPCRARVRHARARRSTTCTTPGSARAEPGACDGQAGNEPSEAASSRRYAVGRNRSPYFSASSSARATNAPRPIWPAAFS